MSNSMFNGWRMEDVWLDRKPSALSKEAAGGGS